MARFRHPCLAPKPDRLLGLFAPFSQILPSYLGGKCCHLFIRLHYGAEPLLGSGTGRSITWQKYVLTIALAEAQERYEYACAYCEELSLPEGLPAEETFEFFENVCGLTKSSETKAFSMTIIKQFCSVIAPR